MYVTVKEQIRENKNTSPVIINITRMDSMTLKMEMDFNVYQEILHRSR